MVSILIGQPGERNSPGEPGRIPTLSPVIRVPGLPVIPSEARDLLSCRTNRACRSRSLVAPLLGMTGNWLLGMPKRALGMTKRGVGLGMTKSGEDSDVDGQAILWLRWHLHDRSDLDRARPRGRNAPRDRGRLVQVLRVDDVVAAELLARLREGAVGRQGFAVADPDGRRGRDRLEGVAGQVFPALLDARGEGAVLLVDGALVLLVEGLPVHLTVVNQKHVSHRS